MGDRAPGEDSRRRVENLAGNVGVEIGRRHRADAALAEAPGGRGVGLRHLLLHLHEHIQRRLGAAEALRQQRPVKAVLDQAGNHGCGEAARALDLVGFPRDQRRQRAARSISPETGKLVHAFPRPFLGFLAGEPQW